MKEQVYLLEQFDDIKILRYDVPAFEGLSLREKLFVYYLSRAALAEEIISGIRIINTIFGSGRHWKVFFGHIKETGRQKSFRLFWCTLKKCFLLTGYIIITRWKSLPLPLLPNILNHFFGKWERNSCTRK